MEITNGLLFKRKERMLNKQFSINTIQNYETDLKLFINYLRLNNKGSMVKSDRFLISLELIKQKTKKLFLKKDLIF